MDVAGGSRSTIEGADRPAGNSPLATFGGKGLAVAPDFSISTRDLPDVHVVALRGELDIVSANGLADSLVVGAGSTVVVDLADLTLRMDQGMVGGPG